MGKPTALIIEDDEMLATFFATTFEDAGYDVLAVYNGGQALSYLSDHIPDVILFDLHLPDISGETILSYITKQAQFAATRVIATSVEGTRVTFLHNQVDIVLTKPVSYRQLLKIAERLHPAFEATEKTHDEAEV